MANTLVSVCFHADGMQAVNFLNKMAFEVDLASIPTDACNKESNIKPRRKAPTFDPVRHKLHFAQHA
jgi:hypothetical protein